MSVPTSSPKARSVSSGAGGETVIAAAGGLVGVALVTVITAVTGWGLAGVAATVALVPAAMAAAVDIGSRRLPDLLVACCAATGLFVAVVARGGLGFAMAAIGACCVAAPLVATHLVMPTSIGFGDAKLAGALGVTVGVVSPEVGTVLLLGLVTVAASCAVGILIGVVLRRRDIAFGPALVAGTALALMAAGQLGGAPLSWQ
jgi:leader peptidase (prepilin peptidase) / N-methyltransferase